jgi:hypothetical protein
MSSEAERGIDCIERRHASPFSGAPLVSHYFARYGNVYSTPPSEQVRGLFERWSIKFFGRLLRSKRPAGRWKARVWVSRADFI